MWARPYWTLKSTASLYASRRKDNLRGQKAIGRSLCFKILSRLLARRLKKWTKGLIHPRQHCGIVDNNIFGALAAIRETTAHVETVAYPGIFFEGGGVQQIQLRTEDRENRDMEAVAP